MTAEASFPKNAAWAVILAAGAGSRLADALAASGGPGRKQYLEFRGAPLFWASARTLARIEQVRGLVLAFPPEDLERMCAVVRDLEADAPLGLPLRLCAGGARRQDSVRLALAQVPEDAAFVLVHDAARPFASAALIRRVLDALNRGAAAAIPGIPVTDTIKAVDAAGRVAKTFERAQLRAVQTPQGFALAPLRAAHARAQAEAWEVTDDAMLLERAGASVAVVAGEAENAKITTPADLALLHARGADAEIPAPRTGWGYDVHRYLDPDEVHAQARPLILGGVPIPGAPRVVAHSDGDVLLHALTDALLGIACAGDIGELFPDSDPATSAMPSCVFVAEALRRVRACGYRPVHADLTLIAQIPRLGPYRERMAASAAQLLGLPRAAVNVKATTEEGLGFTGEKRGLKAAAVVSAVPDRDSRRD